MIVIAGEPGPELFKPTEPGTIIHPTEPPRASE